MTPALTPADLERLEALHAAATKGEWQEGVSGVGNLVSFNGEDVVAVARVYSPRNHALVCALHNAFPALLRLARLATGYREALEGLIDCVLSMDLVINPTSDPHRAAVTRKRFDEAKAALDAGSKK